jgi:hypothetical protein
MRALVLVRGEQRENAYGRYVGELLRAEGLNWYQIEDLEGQDVDHLSSFGLIILTRCYARPSEIAALLEYARHGGRLVVFRPSIRLGQALGLHPRFTAQKKGYVLVDGSHPVGGGLCDQSIQFHGVAEHWDIPEGSPLSAAAWLQSERDAHSDAPALVVGPCRSGQIAVFAYDLPATVAAIRQGDPSLANTLSSGKDGTYRPSEQFTDHLDTACAHIPQADVHTALLSSTIDQLIEYPMPRLWFYPNPYQRSVLIVTSDDDWSQVSEFEALMDAVEARGGHITFYVVPGTNISREMVSAWEKRGHVFSVHPDFRSLVGAPANLLDYGMDEQYLFLPDMLQTSVQDYHEQFGRPVNTIRQHALRWCGYIDAAKTLEELGVKMELNYYSILPYAASHMTGSGRPVKLVDESGRILDVFQQATVLSEDTTIGTHSFSPNWSTAEALARVDAMLSANAEQYYTPIALNAHPVSFATYSGRFVEGVLDSAREHAMPIASADEWLAFTLARYEAEFAAVEYDGTTLKFVLCTQIQPSELTLTWPLGEQTIRSVFLDGEQQPVLVESLWGRPFGMLHLTASQKEHLVQVDFDPRPGLADGDTLHEDQ